jgi:hypothetical protein
LLNTTWQLDKYHEKKNTIRNKLVEDKITDIKKEVIKYIKKPSIDLTRLLSINVKKD